MSCSAILANSARPYYAERLTSALLEILTYCYKGLSWTGSNKTSIVAPQTENPSVRVS